MSEDGWTVVTRAELCAGGWSGHGIVRAVRRGELQRVATGVYLVGVRAGGVEGWRQGVAAALARHPAAAVAGESAAAVLQLDGFDPPVPLLLHAARSASSSSPLVRRRAALSPPIEVAGVPVVSVEEVLLGLGETARPRPGCAAATRSLPVVDLVELAVEAALRRGLTTVARLDAVVAAGQRRAGRCELEAVLARRPVAIAATGSYLETRCVQVLRDAGVVAFERQVPLSDERGLIGVVDLAHRDVVIEVVGRAWHLERFVPDHRRYARLAAAGYRLLTFTFDDIEYRPAHVARTTAAAVLRATA